MTRRQKNGLPSLVRRCHSSVDCGRPATLSFTAAAPGIAAAMTRRLGYRCWQRHGQGVWDLREELGTGAFSIVRAACNRHSGVDAVVKILDKHLSDNRPDVLRMEVNVLRFVSSGALAHTPHFARLLDVFEDDSYVYLVLERCRGFQLAQLLSVRGFLSEEYAAWIIGQVAKALQLLHDAGVLHRDLKPENIMFSDGSPGSSVRLIDFGMGALCDPNSGGSSPLAVAPDDASARELLGSVDYMAPEVLHSQLYSSAADVWALGVLAYTLLCGREPFPSEDHILGSDPTFRERLWGAVSPEAQHFVRGLLAKDPMIRPDAAQALSHPWLSRAKPPRLQARLTFAQSAAAGRHNVQRAASFSGVSAAPDLCCDDVGSILRQHRRVKDVPMAAASHQHHRMSDTSLVGFASPPITLEQLRRATRVSHASLSGRHSSNSGSLNLSPSPRVSPRLTTGGAATASCAAAAAGAAAGKAAAAADGALDAPLGGQGDAEE